MSDPRRIPGARCGWAERLRRGCIPLRRGRPRLIPSAVGAVARRCLFHPARSLPSVKVYGYCVRIGELANSLDLNPRTIRYYESIGLLPEPDRTPSGYRAYGRDDVERLIFIKTAQRLGLTLAEIAEIIAFRDRGQRPCGHVMALLRRQVAELDRRIEEMGRLRDELTRLESEAQGVASATAPTAG